MKNFSFKKFIHIHIIVYIYKKGTTTSIIFFYHKLSPHFRDEENIFCWLNQIILSTWITVCYMLTANVENKYTDIQIPDYHKTQNL